MTPDAGLGSGAGCLGCHFVIVKVACFLRCTVERKQYTETSGSFGSCCIAVSFVCVLKDERHLVCGTGATAFVVWLAYLAMSASSDTSHDQWMVKVG
jgi:hypothetical protein